MSALQTETAEDRKTGDNRSTVLVANRAEIAVRIIRTARELGLRTVAVYSTDDADGAHVRAADEAIPLPGAGATAYLDREAIITAARDGHAELIHPGYGFLSEQAEFARLCAKAGLSFIGPNPATLELCGDKSTARDEFVFEGVDTNLEVLRALPAEERLNGEVTTGYLAERLPELVAPVDASVPYADPETLFGEETIRAGMTGVVIETAAAGATVAAGGEVALLEAMKMQHVVAAAVSVRIVRVLVRAGQTVGPDTALAVVRPADVEGDVTDADSGVDLDIVRADLARVRERHRITLDEVADARARAELFDQLVATAYAHGKALTAATTFELDDVIDPADTRRWITRPADTRPGAR